MIANNKKRRIYSNFEPINTLICCQNGAIDIILTMGNHQGVQHFILNKITPSGINTIEDQPEFKKNFGFEVNLGLLKFSWGASEK